jgi:hypothetical protein
MTDIGQHITAEETPVEDIEMESGDAVVGAVEEDLGFPQIEPEIPKLVLFAE